MKVLGSISLRYEIFVYFIDFFEENTRFYITHSLIHVNILNIYQICDLFEHQIDFFIKDCIMFFIKAACILRT